MKRHPQHGFTSSSKNGWTINFETFYTGLCLGCPIPSFKEFL
jgi:hypothetical protein